MSEEKATVTTPEQTATEPERTFTQSELDAIVGDRLKRERARYADYEDLKTKAAAFDAAEEASKSEMQKALEKAEALQAELDSIKQANAERELKDRIAAETGVPAALLRGSDEADMRGQAEAIKAYAKASPAYPMVKDGGEATHPTISKADILAISDEKARLKAIKENINLFE